MLNAGTKGGADSTAEAIIVQAHNAWSGLTVGASTANAVTVGTLPTSVDGPCR
jgi:hypothetical protein